MLTLDSPRDPASWPEVTARPVPPYTGVVPAPEAALVGLSAGAAFHACVALAEHRGKDMPQLDDVDVDICRADAVEIISDLGADAFPRLHSAEPPRVAGRAARALQSGSVRLVIARRSVDYAGRLTAHLPLATRLLIVKADSSVLVHSDGGAYKPLNWMSPPCHC